MPRGPLATLAKALSFIQDARAEGLNIVVAVVLPPLWIRHTLRACLTNLVQRTEAIGPMLLMHRRRYVNNPFGTRTGMSANVKAGCRHPI